MHNTGLTHLLSKIHEGFYVSFLQFECIVDLNVHCVAIVKVHSLTVAEVTVFTHFWG